MTVFVPRFKANSAWVWPEKKVTDLRNPGKECLTLVIELWD